MATVQNSIARNRAARRNSQNVPLPYTPTGKPVQIQRALRRRDVAGKAEQGQRIIRQSLRLLPHTGKSADKAYNEIKLTKRRARAFTRAGMIAYSLAWFYPIQLLFAFIFVIAMGLTGMTGIEGTVARWLYGDIAQSVMMFSWFLLIVIGSCFMLYAAFMLLMSGVRVWRHSSSLVVFAICLGGYFAPILFFFPWVFLWLAVIVSSQK